MPIYKKDKESPVLLKSMRPWQEHISVFPDTSNFLYREQVSNISMIPDNNKKNT